MNLSEEGIALIKRFEGFCAKVYRDVAGVLTIGYGHALRPGEAFPEGLTAEQAVVLLQKDVAAAERAVMRLVHRALTQHQFDALVDFVFNEGAGKFQASTLRRKINRGDGGVREQFMRWVYAGGRKNAGLIRRRAAEAALFSA